MRIKVFRNLGADLPPFREGEVCTVDDETGRLLVERGLAEALAEPAPRKLRAVPKLAVKAYRPKEEEE